MGGQTGLNQGSLCMTLTFEGELADLPPSSKLVFVALSENQRATHTELVNALQMPESTVYEALSLLQGVGVVEKRSRYGGPCHYVLSSEEKATLA